jgi:hypothetical protein
MMNIKVSRYPDPKATGWAGYIHPDDGSWIAFIDLKGKPYFFLHRHPVTGAVLPDDPVEREAAIKAIDEEGGSRTGMKTAAPDEDGREEGQVIEPLGVRSTPE